MKQKGFFFTLAFVLLSLLASYILYTLVVYLSVFSAARECDSFSSRELLRFQLYGSSVTGDGNTVSATLSIVDSNGNELSTIERSWSGSYLGVEFRRFSMQDKSFVFPSKIYGKASVFEASRSRRRVTSLEKYYDDNFQCLLPGLGATLKERQRLFFIARFATGKFHVPDFGFVDSYLLDLSECRTGRFYSVVYSYDGRLSILEI